VRTASNANPAGTDHHKRTTPKRLSVFIQRPVELFDFGWQGSTWQPKEDDAGVGEALLENQLAEIAVGNDENALLVSGDGKHIFIGKPMGVVAGDGTHVMSKRLQVRDESEVSALVEKECHRVASDQVPLSGFGETSRPVTISLA
jgi:hypothetical protein